MKKKNRPDLFRDCAVHAAVAEAFVLLPLFFFTNNVKYCIISLTGAAVGIAGFFMFVRQIDRILEKGKGKTMFFLSGLAKLLVIAGVFFAASRLAGNGAVFFLQGLAMIYLGIASAGLRRSLQQRRHGT